MEEAGFTRERKEWYEDHDEAVLVAQLQKSEFGGQYYINLGVYPRAYGGVTRPRINHCPLQLRIDHLLAEERQGPSQWFLNDEDRKHSSMERSQFLRQVMREKGVPFLRACATVQGIKLMLASGQLEYAAIFKVLRDRLTDSPASHG